MTSSMTTTAASTASAKRRRWKRKSPGFSRPDGVSEPQFLIQAEISSIYKKDGSVRKVHNVVIMPSLESADKLSNKLAAIGNITSDGRPILGLDCEHLLEMVLEADERGVLIPAHIWTPWFSLFGSKSGFDALEDCFGSLSSHIFALETGLSSDPDMNRLWSALDRYALVSNSDAHSGENLGREANLFEGTPSYDGIFDALRRAARDEEGSGCIYRGTVEFFPEEGKYHLDGHRACNVVLEPEESMKIGNIWPGMRQAAHRRRTPPGHGAGRPQGPGHAQARSGIRLAVPASGNARRTAFRRPQKPKSAGKAVRTGPLVRFGNGYFAHGPRVGFAPALGRPRRGRGPYAPGRRHQGSGL